MPYDPKTPPALLANGIGGAVGLRHYGYRNTTDTVADVLAAGYFTNARKIGMRAGDALRFVDGNGDSHHLQVAAIDGDTGAGTVAFPAVAPEAIPEADLLDVTEYPATVVVFQDGRQVQVPIEQASNTLIEIATEEEAIEGALNAKRMTPLRSAQAIAAQVPPIINSQVPPIIQTSVIDIYDPQGIAADAFRRENHTGFSEIGSTPGASLPSHAWAIANYHPVSAPDDIRTSGYATAGDGGGALYKKVVAEPSHAGKFSITVGGESVWYEIAETVINVRQFGAKGDGVTDDTLAIQNAITRLDDDHTALYFPSGVYKVTDNLVITNKAVHIYGDGIGGSEIVDTGVTGWVLTLDQDNFNHFVLIDDLRFTTTQQELSSAISITFSELDMIYDAHQFRCHLERLEVVGVDPANHGFLNGIKLTRVRNGRATQVNVAGRQSGTGPAAFMHMQDAWYQTDKGSFMWIACDVICATRAFRGDGHLEGCIWTSCNIAAVGTGWDFQLNNDFPDFSLNKCHGAFFNVGVSLVNFHQSNISNCLFYRREEATNASSVGISLNSCGSISISNTRVLNMNQGVGGMYGIVATDSEYVQVTGCQVVGAIECYVVNGTSSNCRFYDNDADNYAVFYSCSASGTGNVRRNSPALITGERNSGGAVAVNNAEVAVASKDIGSVEIGDVYMVTAKVRVNKDASAGMVDAIVRKSTGTATVIFDFESSNAQSNSYAPANGSLLVTLATRMTVTGRGTCTLGLSCYIGGSAGTVPINEGQMTITRL